MDPGAALGGDADLFVTLVPFVADADFGVALDFGVDDAGGLDPTLLLAPGGSGLL